MTKSNASNFLPKIASTKKVIEEINEHFGFLKWGLKRVFLPIAVFYVLIGFFLQEYVLGALFTALIVYLYANFLPDFDAFFPHNSKIESKKASKIGKQITLFFAPIMIYYILSKKTMPLDLGSKKAFHNKRALIEFTIFLFAFGLILYFSLLKAFFFALFGFLGYLTHLIVDKEIKL
jgi:hypothetical protein